MQENEKAFSKRYEALQQFVDLANLLTPGVEWPTPDELAQFGVRIMRGDESDESSAALDHQRHAAIEPVWQDALRRFRPTAADRKAFGGFQGQLAVFRPRASE